MIQDYAEAGCRNEDTMPDGPKVRRRVTTLHRQLCQRPEAGLRDALSVLDWISLYALAVNKENASGGRMVTVLTNGATGIIPVAPHHYTCFIPGADDDGVTHFLFTAAVIGIPYKENASISGAEVGYQGEVRVACSTAIGTLCEIFGGSVQQVEDTAGIGMERNLGLTCDPVGGLVQVSCIEHNMVAPVRTINTVRMTLRGDGQYFISLDKIVRTMRQTGTNMKNKYKETAHGGLAMNIIEY